MKTIFSERCNTMMIAAIGQMLSEIAEPGFNHHVERTPTRVVNAYSELLSGVREDPALVLRISFEETSYDEMVTVEIGRAHV